MEAQSAKVPGEISGSAEHHLREVQALLERIIRLGRFNLTVNARKTAADPAKRDEPEWVVEFSGADADLLLEGKAELLDALAYVASKAARLDEDFHNKVVFDCRDYRRLRAEELKLTAQLAAERVIESGEPFALNPMNALDRRSIHLALKDQPLVRTESQGTGAARQVVILPQKTEARDKRRETSR
jgi:spoIIIJ-associated protein